MEPFSVAAGAVSCTSAAFKVCSKSKKVLQGLYHAPEVVNEILDDVAKFQRLVSTIRDSCCNASESTFIRPNDVATMSDLLAQAERKLVQVEMVLEYEMIDERIDDEKILISRLGTYRNEKEVVQLLQEFRTVLDTISTVWQVIAL